MVGDGVKLSQQQQQPQQPQMGSSSIEDDAVKRNTDCVYFLASPLTCKKGRECEYRHSEYARVNPRDCWFWMNGNCLNPKCSFRHPPLDGLLGTQVEASGASSITPSKPAVSSSTHISNNASKQLVPPCIFFQKGMCLKADKCTFLHGSNVTSIKSPLITKPPSISDAFPFKKSFGNLAKCVQEQKNSQTRITGPVEAQNMKQFQKDENSPLKNLDGEIRSKQNSSLITAEDPVSRANHMHLSDDISLENGIDADESFRESSPGFDVLVDDELRDPDFYHDKDHQFGRTRRHERPLDYDSMIDVDEERFHDPHGFDSSYHPIRGQYDHMSSPEGKFVGKPRVPKRGFAQVESFDQIDRMDLRHQLSKQRRVPYSQNHMEEPRYQDRSLRNRLAGRINMPSNSFPINGNHHFSSDLERRRNRRRSPPGRPQISSQVGRFMDRGNDGLFNNGRNSRGTDFAAPKSLAELKEEKNGEKRGSLSSQMQYEGDVLFEGPKPLNAILKKKRESGGDEAFCDIKTERKEVDEETKRSAILGDGLVESETEDQDELLEEGDEETEGIYGEEGDEELLEEDEEFSEEMEGEEEEDEFAKRMAAILS